MLIAPNGSPSPSPSRRPANDVFINYMLIAGVTALVVYTLMLGMGLLSGRIAAERAYALMSVPPLVTAIWQMIGFVRQPGSQGSLGDTGLLVGSIGWLAAGITLLVMHGAVTKGVAAGQRIDQVQPPAAAWLLAIMAVVGIVGGAALSWRMWQKMMRADDIF